MLDDDPFEISSWEDYCLKCIKLNDLNRFKDALSNYIYLTGNPFWTELRAWANSMVGELRQERMMISKYGPNFRQILAEKYAHKGG